jgi:hypothetical protein
MVQRLVEDAFPAFRRVLLLMLLFEAHLDDTGCEAVESMVGFEHFASMLVSDQNESSESCVEEPTSFDSMD